MIGLVPVVVVVAIGVLVFSGGLTASVGAVQIFRSLTSAAAVLFASGYGLVMWGHLRQREHAIVLALTWIVVVAVSGAALLTSWQLLFANDTVAAGVPAALLVLVLTGVVGTALLPLARRLTSS
ncbi:MAG: hypothetical protein M3071_15140 [Actinomycetota bacterium]|nr:hypothetical protein [Actinomycetota bacterium]